MKQKIVVGMSGGVDSSVVVALLVDQGHEVSGVYIEAYNEPGCRADQDRQDALKVAGQLGIPFQVLDLKKEYKEKVVKYFYDEYRAGRTPNPDVMCNKEIKFGLFLDWAKEKEYDKVATGHYARIADSGFLQRGIDKGKDQSYFLWRVSSERLEHVIFPLGKMKKDQVRKKARELELPNWNKSDSMGVCMMGELDVVGKLREELGEKTGEVVMGGQVVGEHKGLWFSTMGQRVGQETDLQGQALKGVGVDTTAKPALYVVGKDVEENRIVIGRREDGYVSKIRLENTEKYIERFGKKIYLRIRNLGEMIEIESLEEVTRLDSARQVGEWEIKLTGKVWGVASGQSGVIYDDEGIVVGGGIIV